MNRRSLIILVGIALLIGLYFYDRDNRTDTILAAEVVSLEDQDNEAGPDSWHMVVQIDGTDIALEPLEKRPVVAAGDRICVTRTTRPGQPDEHTYSPSASC